MNRWSDGRTGMLPPKRDASNGLQEEDEVELWDGYNKEPGQQRRTSAHVQAGSAGCADPLSPGLGKDETKITIKHEICVRYGSGDMGSR